MVCSYLNADGSVRWFLVIIIAVFSHNSAVLAFQTPASPPAGTITRTTFTYKVITGESGYGYDIFADGRMLIHQPHIPGVEGNEGFRSKKDSQKVAELVISKLKKGEMPPAVTRDELRKLKVIN